MGVVLGTQAVDYIVCTCLVASVEVLGNLYQ